MKTYTQHNNIVEFYKDGDHVGTIDYSNKSSSYINDAINNWLDGILTVETVERYSVTGV